MPLNDFKPGQPTVFDHRAKTHKSITDKWDVNGFYKACAAIACGDGCKAKEILDLGIGTGHELYEIFKISPDIKITGIDASLVMLEQLKIEHSVHMEQIKLINDSVFSYEFPRRQFDTVLASATLHHFGFKQRRYIYKQVRKALKPSGIYVEADKFISSSLEVANFLSTPSDIYDGVQDLSHLEVHRDIPLSMKTVIINLLSEGFVKLRVAHEDIFRGR